jgi:septal ring factor EnvC (AmiA/AmiB activator)
VILNPLSFNNLRCLSSLVFACLLISITFNAPLFAADLNKIQNQINESKQTKAQQERQQRQLENELQKSEQAIADASLKVNQTQKEINDQRNALDALKKNNTQLKQNKIKQQALLQQQLVSAYMAGQNDLIKLLLNQEDLTKIGRSKSYYQYLNDARLESIEALNTTQLALISNQEKQTATLASLESLLQQEKQTQTTLTAEKSKRDNALNTLKKDINYQNKKIAELSRSEKALQARIIKEQQARKAKELAAAKAKAAEAQRSKQRAQVRAEAQAKATAKAIATRPADKPVVKATTQSTTKVQPNVKLARQKGKLLWPVEAKVLNSFGSARSSQVKWKGIVIAANEGEKVRASANGRVLFAGYFKGYGMVIALDHGDNYITLYGYNQTLLQKAGDAVQQGDAIALAGHSGGQNQNSLYFELSHKGQAQDPIKWLSRRK